jgi:phosphoenolpyruvate carboxylase
MNDLNELAIMISDVIDERYERLKYAQKENYIAFNQSTTDEKMTDFEVHTSYNNSNSETEVYSIFKRIQQIGKAVGIRMNFNNQDASLTDELS